MDDDPAIFPEDEWEIEPLTTVREDVVRLAGVTLGMLVVACVVLGIAAR